MKDDVQITVELKADFAWLRDTHGLNDEMFGSLIASKVEARDHINFFTVMIFISNGAVMTLALCLMGWGLREGMSDLSIVRGLAAIIGAATFLWFCVVFVRGVKSVRATEYVARKHGLI